MLSYKQLNFLHLYVTPVFHLLLYATPVFHLLLYATPVAVLMRTNGFMISFSQQPNLVSDKTNN